MELISLPGYTFDEKVNIAQRHLLPKQIKARGMAPEDVKISNKLLFDIATGYTREAGVRNFEREIASVCRAKAVEYADARDNGELAAYRAEVSKENIEEILGVS